MAGRDGATILSRRAVLSALGISSVALGTMGACGGNVERTGEGRAGSAGRISNFGGANSGGSGALPPGGRGGAGGAPGGRGGTGGAPGGRGGSTMGGTGGQ